MSSKYILFKEASKYMEIRIKNNRYFFFCVLTLILTLSESAYGETLYQAYLSTLNTNPQIRESVATEEAAFHAYEQLRAGNFPVIGLAYNLGRGKGQAFSPQTLGIGYQTNNIQHQAINISQLIFDGGALGNRVSSAEMQYDSTMQSTWAKVNEIALKAASAYLAVLRAKQMVITSKQNVSMYATQVVIQKKRYQGGVGLLSDYVLTKSRYDQALLNLNIIKLQLANAITDYQHVIGHPPQNLLDPKDPSYDLPVTLMEAEVIANHCHPAIRAEQAAVKSAWYNVKAANAVVFFPSVSLQTSVSRDNNLNAIPGKITTMQGYIAITYNIFNGGADVAAKQKAEAQLVSSKAHLENKYDEIESAIQQIWNEIHITQQDLKILKQRLRVNTQLVSAFNKEWKIGKRTLLDLTESQNELYNIRLAIINGEYKLKIDQLTLLANAGQLASYLAHEAKGTMTC